MMSTVCLFGNPFPQNFKEVTDQSSLLNTGTLLSASVCFSTENLFYTFTPNLLMEIFAC